MYIFTLYSENLTIYSIKCNKGFKITANNMCFFKRLTISQSMGGKFMSYRSNSDFCPIFIIINVNISGRKKVWHKFHAWAHQQWLLSPGWMYNCRNAGTATWHTKHVSSCCPHPQQLLENYYFLAHPSLCTLCCIFKGNRIAFLFRTGLFTPPIWVDVINKDLST